MMVLYIRMCRPGIQNAMSLDQLEEQYQSKDYSAQGKYLYLMMDEASGDSYASVTFLADELKGMIRDIMGDGNWRIFVGLDTNYHCRTSQSYYDSMYYTAYQDISGQIAFNFGNGEYRINVFCSYLGISKSGNCNDYYDRSTDRTQTGR